jgi:hypothetical protein
VNEALEASFLVLDDVEEGAATRILTVALRTSSTLSTYEGWSQEGFFEAVTRWNDAVE